MLTQSLFFNIMFLILNSKGVICLPGVYVRDNESFEEAFKRFKKQCERAGILSEIKKREHYEKPSEKKKKKALAARKKALKKKRLSERKK